MDGCDNFKLNDYATMGAIVFAIGTIIVSVVPPIVVNANELFFITSEVQSFFARFAWLAENGLES